MTSFEGVEVATRQTQRALLFVLSALVIILGLFSLDLLQIGTYTDDALYILLAESLAEGRGFVEAWHPTPVPHTLAPPGYPVLLMPLVILFPRNYEILRLISIGSTWIALALLYLLASKHFLPRTALLILGATALSSQIVGLGGQIMSEAPYLAFSISSLVAMEYYQEADSGRKRWLWFGLSLLAGLSSYFIRTVGLSLGAAIVAYLLARLDLKRAAIAGACFSLGVGLWALRNATVGSGTLGYGFGPEVLLQQITDWSNTSANLRNVGLSWIPNALVPVFGPKIVTALSGYGLGILTSLAAFVISSVALTGLVRGIIRTKSLSYFYLLCYLALILFTPSYMLTMRNLIPVLPLLYMCFLSAAETGEHTIRARTNRVAAGETAQPILIGLAAVIMLLNIGRSVQGIISPVRERIPDVTVGTTWIEANSNGDAVVMVHPTWERPAALYTRRTVVTLPQRMAGDHIIDKALNEGITHILVTPPLRASLTKFVPELDEATNELLSVLEKTGHPFASVFTDAENGVYVFQRSY